MNEIAVVSQPTSQPIATTPSKPSLAVRMFSNSNHAESKAVAETHDQRVTRQEAEDYKEVTNPARFPPHAIPLAQKLMQTYGGQDVRNAVAAAGIGSKVWVMDLAARIQMALDAKDAEIAALKRNQR